MRTRFSAAALLGLAACGDPGSTADEALDAAGEAADRIPCAVEGETGLEQVCTVERLTGDEGPILTIRHTSGGFRRFPPTSHGPGGIAPNGPGAATLSFLPTHRS